MVFALCFFSLRHAPYNLRSDNPAFYLLQGSFSNSACFVLRRLPLPPKREVSTFHSRKKCLLCIMPYFAPLWTSLEHRCITLCTCRIYYSTISSLYFICNGFSHFYYLLSQLFFKCYFLLYIYILWFYILLSLRCFGSTLLYMAVFFPLFFRSFDVETSF